ncbi:MAG: hypothetical protein K1X78_28935, partial [Verrucomicrobiaceae bacterium]|nr:hypothetical protein [Verrucomicrobiaceae bacterium]
MKNNPRSAVVPESSLASAAMQSRTRLRARRFIHALSVWLAAFVALSSSSHAAVAPLGAGTQAVGADFTATVIVPAGTNRILVVTVSHADDLGQSYTSVTFGGQAMTKAIERNDDNDGATGINGAAYDSIWYRVLGDSASATSGFVAVTPRPAGAGTKPTTWISAQAFSGVDQTLPIASTGATSNPNGTNLSSRLVLASSAGDMVYDLFDTYNFTSGLTLTEGAGQTGVASSLDVTLSTVSGLATTYTGFGSYRTTYKAAVDVGTATSWTSNTVAMIHTAICLKAAGTPGAGSSASVQWAQTSANNSYGRAYCVGAMSNGDIVAGYQISGSGTLADVRVIRHAAATGNVVWTRDLNLGSSSDRITDIAVDPQTGDTFICAEATVTGQNLNWFIVKLNGADGTVAWNTTHSGSANQNDSPLALTITTDGNIVVVGTTTTAVNFFARAAKYNRATGAEMWSYVHPTGATTFNDVAADSAGNAIACGNVNGAVFDGILTKLPEAPFSGTSVSALWDATPYNGPGNSSDNFLALAIDSANNIGIAATTNGGASGNDINILKYNGATGAKLWDRQVNGTANSTDSCNDVVVDNNNDFYVSGTIRNSGTDNIAWVGKTNGTDGTIAWTHTKNGPTANGNDRYLALRWFGGSIYAAGRVDDTTPGTFKDLLLTRLNTATGAEQWSTTYNGTTNYEDIPGLRSQMVVPANDTVIVAAQGEDSTALPLNGLVVKFAAAASPTVTASTGSLALGTATQGSAGTEQSFTVSGSSLTANLVVTAPTGVEVSTTSGSGFGASVSLPPGSGSVATTTIYARIKSSAASGVVSGNITVASTGATTQNVSVSGTVNPAPVAVSSLNRTSGTPSNLANLTWQITFDQAITGLQASNFGLANSGLTGPSITSVTNPNFPAASTTWNITASTGTGDGTLGLN